MRAAPLDVFGCALDGTNLVEASAGTGKTWSICALVLRLLLERKLALQHILVVTFTNAAAAELRERIRSRIVQTLARLRGGGAPAADPFVDALLRSLRTRHALADAETALRLEQALQDFDEASIFTIHGFCQRALADAPFSAGAPMVPQQLADDTELRLEVVHDFWRRRIAGGAAPPELAAHLLARGDTPETLARLLTRQLAKPLSQLRWPAALDTAQAASDAALAPLDLTALAAAHAGVRSLWSAGRDAILRCVSEALPRLSANVYNAGSLATAAASWDAWLAGDEVLLARDGLAKLDLLSATRLQPKKNQAPVQPHAFFEQAAALLALRDAAEQTQALQRLRLLRELLADGPPALRRAKRERRVLAYNDMLADLHERITRRTAAETPSQPGGRPPPAERPGTAGASAGAGFVAALRARFPAALIDEFQDTDPLQFAIFNGLYGDGAAPLFLVGDPKQAIYSFRNADLHTYLQARARSGAEYTLVENQRSTRELLAGLNALFAANDQAFMLPGLAYRAVDYGAKPRPVLIDRSEARAPLQLWTLPRDADGQPLPKDDARAAAARACAAEIARLLAAGGRGEVTLGGRALAGGDIAVLVRSHAQGSRMRQALATFGVGCVELSQASVFASTDALDLERVLAAVLEPTRERVLRAALSTEVMGLDAAAVEAVSADEPRWLGFVARFAGYRETWLQRGIGVMLRQWMAGEACSERLLARADGERRLTNLLHLSERLHEASAMHPAPEALLRWLRSQRTHADGPGGADDAAQLRLESDRNLVQIATIHKSKGLEYALVFCPFLWDGAPGGSGDRLEGCEYHDDAGRPVVDFRTLDKAAAAAVKQQLALERAAENLRLVYVALTRAVQRCTVVVGAYTRRHGRTVSTAESRRAVLNWLVAGQGLAPSDWLQNKLAVAAIDAAWSELARRHAPAIGIAALPADAGAAVRLAWPATGTLAALDPPRRIPAGWRIGSYSSLAHGARSDSAAIDHDLRALAPGAAEAAPVGDARAAATVAARVTSHILTAVAVSTSAPNVGRDDILRFPRGPAAGDCVHAVFERVDFCDASGWPAAIAAALRAQPQPTPDADTAQRLPHMLAAMLDDVLHTPLPGAGRLADVPRGRRRVELEFSLPVRRLAAHDLALLLGGHGYPVPALAFGSLDGYLRGFIDLVFEQAGRFHIVDWKSNHLGNTPRDYGAAALAHAMEQQGYHLQYLLYAVALHRWLSQRLPGYRYDDHFGGVLYLFVRGVRPGWIDDHGTPAGVFAHRPSLPVIEQLSGLLGDVRGRA